MNVRGNSRRFRYLLASLVLMLLSFSLSPAFVAKSPAPNAAAPPLVLELRLNGEVEPILATYIDEGLADAAQRHAALVLITMDTPGGLSDSMTDIIHHISGFARSRCCLCGSGWRAWCVRGIPDSSLGGHCCHGTGNANRRCHADFRSWLDFHAHG